MNVVQTDILFDFYCRVFLLADSFQLLLQRDELFGVHSNAVVRTGKLNVISVEKGSF